MDLEWTSRPHRRYNPLTGEWILVSPQRTQRPWQGAVEKQPYNPGVAYDPKCYLCPGNARAGGIRNPDYKSTFVFDNDFPALLPDTRYKNIDENGLIAAHSERGICRVGCFSPRHDLTVANMDSASLKLVVEMWREQYSDLGSQPFINNVQIFENRGEAMGASNPHPHCQIWANESIPNEIGKETASQMEYSRRKASCLLCDYVALEAAGERIVFQNDCFVVITPFWATWPFETMVVSKRHITGMDELSDTDGLALADALRNITHTYDRIFDVPFPYSMGFHQRPTDGGVHDYWHFHAHFFPPLLRSATVRKFMVGYELLAESQRDLTPEMAAARLRSIQSSPE
jgi:UDPglucose--hexose-1-phosphate uridylyltransferase